MTGLANPPHDIACNTLPCSFTRMGPQPLPARRRRPGGLVRVGQAPGRLGEAAPAPLHGPGPVRAGGGRGLRAALGGGAPIRRAQADGRHGRDVAAGPQNAPALAAPGPDRPRTACPTDRAGGAGGARASAGRWLAQAGDADAGPGQGRACPPVRRYPGLPPRARNPQENRPCSWYRTARERRRRMTSGSNPRPPPYRSRKRRDQTRTAGAAAPRKLETRVLLSIIAKYAVQAGIPVWNGIVLDLLNLLWLFGSCVKVIK